MKRDDTFQDEERPVEGLTDLRQVTPPPSLVPRVMGRIATESPPGLWAWLRRPRRIELRLSPMGAGAVVLGALTAAWMLMSSIPERPPGTVAHEVVVPPVARSGETVLVRFVLTAGGARRVALAGDFNGWNTDRTVLEDGNADGTFVATVELPPGTYQYMFVVDGEWITDPAADEKRPDGFGRQNAILRL